MSQNPLAGIDIHSHVVPEHFPAWAGKHAPSGWPATVAAPVQNCRCHRHVMIDNKIYRTISDQCWSVPQRLDDLPAMGLAHQVMSPMPELLSYWLPVEHAQPLIRYLNETIAAMVAESAGSLLGMAAVPLQDIDLAIAELHYAVTSLKLSAVEIGSNINGMALGDSRLRPFFEACVDLDVPVFVHALKPAGMDRLVGPAQLQQVLAYPTDVGLAAASVITGNLLRDCPGLRIAFSHGGGSFALLLSRLQQGWQTFPSLRDTLQTSPAVQSRQLFFDALVFDPTTLRFLVEQLGTSQLMLGTDYPFNFREQQPLQMVLDCGFSDDISRALIYANAERFLGLSLTSSGVPA
jgi:aminocarboxymuconate-semialdehyde decarboxylase